MTPILRLAYLTVIPLLAVVVVACGGGRPTLKAFAGGGQGHGRGLTISGDGVGTADVYWGCCDFVLAVKFRLTRPRAVRGGLEATETATAVRIGDRRAFGRVWKRPRVGESATIRLKDGVFTDGLSGENYCSPKAKHWVCGA